MQNNIKSLCLVALTSLCLNAPPAFSQDSGASREFSSIVEEQGLLLRQIGRLRGTMEVLLKSLEAEGRDATASILRNALEKLDERTERGDDGHPLTMEERMDRIHESLGKRQLIQSLASQRELVTELEALLSILLDRKNLESLEEKIDELRQMQESIKQLASREKELRGATQALKQKSSNPSHQKLEAELAKLAKQEAALLRENEKLGRESGSLELERLEQTLNRLLADQRKDANLLAAWNPQEDEQLLAARKPLNAALAAEQQAANLGRTREMLNALNQALRASAELDNPQGLDKARLDALAERLEAELKEARRRAELGQGEESLVEAAEALGKAQEAMSDAQAGQADPLSAAKEIEQATKALAESAEKARQQAQAARAEARKTLEGLTESESLAGLEAKAIDELLEKAESAAESGDKHQAAGATSEAAAKQDRARADLANLAEALSGAQEEQAKQTERLERGLQTMPQAETKAGKQAAEALGQAAEKMKSASEAARRGEAEEAAEKARDAEAALGRALEALGQSRKQAAGNQAEAQKAGAEAQAQAAEQADKLSQLAESAALSEESKAALQGAMQEAKQAMLKAQEELQEGRSASAAQSQREALSELGKAQQAAEEGVTPESSSDKQEAQRLAKEQAAIKQEILDLAKRIADRENPSPTPNMENAQAAAEQAEQDLEEGALSSAEEEENKVIQELEQTSKQLEKEEEQYQTLRDEEKLFAIAEELQGMLASHIEQMQALREVDAARKNEAKPSRAQRLHLRRISREEETLSTRCSEMSGALAEEGSTVSAQLLLDASDDLGRVAQALGERGDFQTGDRTQALQRDAEETMNWILEALKDEQDRRKDPKQEKKQQQEEQQQEDESKESLIPDTAELKLLRRMEVRLQNSVSMILELNPELSDPDKLDPYVLRDIERLALQHQKITEQFIMMRTRLGIPSEGQE